MRFDSFTRCAIVAFSSLTVLACSLALSGCGGSDGVEVASTTADGKKLSADDRAAADFVLSKIKEHWLQNSDGWTSEFLNRNMFGEVLPGNPDTRFRQLREFKFAIEPEPISDTMKLNGTDYRAGVQFEKTSERFYRTVQTFEGPQGWSLWEDEFPSFGMAVERRNGTWLISDSDLWEGILPTGNVPAGK